MAAEGNLDKFMADRAKGIASAVTRAVRSVTFGLQRELRRQVRKANFKKDGLEKLVSAKVFPKKGYLADAEGVVYSNAQVQRNGGEVDLIEVFSTGATITAKGGKWLAIPTADAATARGGQTSSKYRPSAIQSLRDSANAPYLFGKENRGSRQNIRRARKRLGALTATGQSDLQFIKTKKPGLAMLAYVDPRTGERVIAYWLVKQVKIRKRLDIKRAEGKWLPKLEPKINRNLDRFTYRTGDDLN